MMYNKTVKRIGVVGISFLGSSRLNNIASEIGLLKNCLREMSVGIEEKLLLFQSPPRRHDIRYFFGSCKAPYTLLRLELGFFLDLEIRSAGRNPYCF